MTVPSFLCEKLFPALYDPAATLVFGKRRLKKTDDTFKAQMLAHHMVRELMFWDRYSAYMSSIDVKSQTLIAYTSVVLVVISLFYTAAFPQDRFTQLFSLGMLIAHLAIVACLLRCLSITGYRFSSIDFTEVCKNFEELSTWGQSTESNAHKPPIWDLRFEQEALVDTILEKHRAFARSYEPERSKRRHELEQLISSRLGDKQASTLNNSNETSSKAQDFIQMLHEKFEEIRESIEVEILYREAIYINCRRHASILAFTMIILVLLKAIVVFR